jgi:branched-chain amino acid transport system permease protein
VSSPIPSGLEGSVSVGALVFPKFRLAIIIAAPVVAAAIILTLRLTPVGAKVRASVDDVDVARVSGVRVPLLYMVVFGFGGLLAGFAGIWGGAFASLAPEDGFSFLFLAVVVIVLGGMGSISGALIAGLGIGLIEQFGRTYFPEWALFFMYGLSTLVLVTRPQGLFGKEVRRQDA